MNKVVNTISGRLSLRTPQREALEILERVADIINTPQKIDASEALARIASEFKTVTDFERGFPSLCFALATGVGKTRLMGAFISYLYIAKQVRHFFVLAPNLTIYNKLVADFTPNTPKYVFQGIGEFAANLPQVVTGDTYNMRGSISSDHQLTMFGSIQINIFNVGKINTKEGRKVRRLSEYLGESYFDYLAGLDDLVLIMDESHRYRATAGVAAINELNPVLGLELTGTPFTESARGPVDFKNIIYNYPLANALADGFVKEPMVATRENFNASDYSQDELERIKLEDGVRIHENTKVELEVYARQNDKRIVKPFMLVVAMDVAHAGSLVARIKSDDFFDGRYKDKVITVHSALRGEERDETVEQLVGVENPANPTEIVVHVNMLKEGWDVTNLYTIVPLRAANARTLVEQSVGRGLRLPYGKRVGVSAVDRLTIVAHDKFQEIVDEARNPNSIIKRGATVEEILSCGAKQAFRVEPSIVDAVQPSTNAPDAEGGGNASTNPVLTFETAAERDAARQTLEVLHLFEHRPSSRELAQPDTIEAIVREVTAKRAVIAPALEELDEPVNLAQVVEKTVRAYSERSIDIPRITMVPTGEVSFGFNAFTLDTSGIRLLPVAEELVLQSLQDEKRHRLVSEEDARTVEERPENYLVARLMDFGDICYDDHADLLYDLAGQMIAHLRSYLPGDAAVLNVARYHRRSLADLIYAQMQEHHWERLGEYKVKVSKGFTALRSINFTAAAGETLRDYRKPVEDKLYIRGMRFGGFSKCLYPVQKFDTDTERRFAVICEREALKWFKPARGQFQIDYKNGQTYEPDFVVETATTKLLVEPKRANEMSDKEVQAKAKAAAIWCRHATAHEASVDGGKPWKYLLIPHDAIEENKTLKGLAATYAVEELD
jgi:type III restriction enzyme